MKRLSSVGQKEVEQMTNKYTKKQLEEQQNINRRINHDDIINIGLDQAIMIVKGGAE